MVEINRKFNVESRALTDSGQTYSGQQFDSLSTTLHISYEPEGFLEDEKDGKVVRPFIIFDVEDDNGNPMMFGNFVPPTTSPVEAPQMSHPIFDGYTFKIPYSVTSRVKRSPLGYQLFFVRTDKETDPIEAPITGADLGDVEYILSKVDHIVLKESIAEESLISNLPDMMKPISPGLDPTITKWIEIFRVNCVKAPLRIIPRDNALWLTYSTLDTAQPDVEIPTGNKINQLPLIKEELFDGALLAYSQAAGGFIGRSRPKAVVNQDADGITVDDVVLQHASETQDGLMSKDMVSSLNGKADAVDSATKKELSDGLDAVRAEIPLDTGDLTNNAGFITNATNDLVNYFRKSEVYDKGTIDNMLSLIPKFRVEVKDVLPDTGENAVLYFIPNAADPNNVYDEYIWVNNTWELIGTTSFKLSFSETADGISINDHALQLADATRNGLMTKEMVTEFRGKQDAGDYALKSEVALKADQTELKRVEAAIPVDISELNNDTGYLTEPDVQKIVLDNYYTKEDTDKMLALKTDVLAALPPWDPAVAYKLGSTVVWEDKLYISQTGEGNLNQDPSTEGSVFWNAIIAGDTPAPKPPAASPVKTFIIGDGESTELVIHHNMGSFDLFFSVRTKDLMYVQAAIQALDVNTVKLYFAEPPAENSITVAIMTGKQGGIEQNVETFEQVNPSYTWTVASSFRNPVFVQTFNTMGEQIYGDIIQTIDPAGTRHVSVKFAQEQSGTIVLKEVFDQDVYRFTNESTWVIKHNKGRMVGVQLYNEQYGQLRADVIQDAQSKNEVRVEFSEPMSGMAIVI